ncbi:hypothetical protein [Aquimarina sp. Aq107]|uniref:hypothetical protein n=1 Tax=Aquimarina sp. Aq107 TaxID=1191912 RepID=UPI000D55CD3E|nr:hypothetical protein [Aquimarina sp. Aq107]
MKRETLYKIAVLVLLIINGVQISFFLVTKKPRKNSKQHHKPSAREILHLNTNQDNQFKEFSRTHGEAMRLLQEDQKESVRTYFLEPTDSLLRHISDIEAKKIKITKKHFENMKSILNKEQLTYYEDFKKKALKFILR